MADIFLQKLGLEKRHPILFLAPMEGITNPIFRDAVIEVGGVTIVATEFVRVTNVRQRIAPFVRHNVPLQVQLMGTDADTLQGCISFLKARDLLTDEDWIDLNVGCPSRRVNSHGAGAKLLETPDVLVKIIRGMRAVHPGPLSIKMRVGFRSAADFPALLDTLAEAPLDFITLHARTQCDGYHAAAQWEYLAQATSTLPFPVIGNGDVWTANDALKMLDTTGVRGVMCGRGVLANPFLLKEIGAEVSLSKNAASVNTSTMRGSSSHTARDVICFTRGLLDAYRAHSGSDQQYVGFFKEFCGFLRRNPNGPPALFERIKRLDTLTEIRAVLDSLVNEDGADANASSL